MSEIDSYKSQEIDDSSEYYDPEQDSQFEGQFLNERGDRHSDESSSYHISPHVDPNSTNKKYVRRLNPILEKHVRVEFFPTNVTPNSLIKNAVSGSHQYIDGRFLRAGTRDEDLFFTVILATGEFGQNAPVLFYDNPEQYERHFFAKVSQKIKEKWTSKRDDALHALMSKPTHHTTNTMNVEPGVVCVK